MHLHDFSWIVILLGFAALSNYFIGALALRRFPHSILHICYFCTTFFTGSWALLNFLWLLSPAHQTLFEDRLAVACLPLTNTFFLYFAAFAPRHGRQRPRGWMAGVAVAALAGVYIAFTRLVFDGLRPGAFSPVEVYGPLFWPYAVIWLAVFLAGVILLIRKLMAARDPFDRARLKVLVAGGLIPLLLGPPIYIIPHMLGSKGILSAVSALTPATSSFSMLLNAYAIMRYQLFDIRLARRSAVVVMIHSFIHACFIGLMIILILEPRMYGLSYSHLLTLIAIVFTATLFFPFTDYAISGFADRFLFRKAKNRDESVRRFARFAAGAQPLDGLARNVCAFLRTEFQVSGAVIFFQDEHRDPEIAVITADPGEFQFDIPLELKEAVLSFTQNDAPHVVSRYEIEVNDKHPLLGFLPLFINAGVEIFIPLEMAGHCVGGIFIGRKDGGGAYSGQDLHLIELLADSVAPALLNACLDERIKESHRKYRELFERAGDALLIVSGPERIIHETNLSAADIFACGCDALCGKPLTHIAPPENRVLLKQLIENGSGRKGIPEITLQRNDKTLFTAEVYAVELEDGGMAVNVRDITERKRVEEELLMMKKIESVGVLAGGIAHDFNNIIATILGSAQTALSAMRDGDERQRERIQRIIKVSRRGRDLSAKLLAFARKEKLNVQSASINNLISEIIEMLGGNKNIAIEADLNENIPNITMDVTQIYQTLLNICMNACDSMGERGLLHIETFETYLDENFRAVHENLTPGRYCAVKIQDNGGGIPEELMQKIYEPFFTTKENGKGTGLGLSAAIGIVRNHNGHIDVTSKVGVGTTVTIYLPMNGDTEHISAASEKQQPDSARRNTILIVDDDEDYTVMIQESLEMSGFHALTAESGMMAIEILKSRGNDLDLILLDMKMPGMDGAETFHTIRKISPAAKVVICSGFSPDGKVSELLKEGAVDFVQKPFVMDDLFKLIRRVLAIIN